jgi:hypothetical protein
MSNAAPPMVLQRAPLDRPFDTIFGLLRVRPAAQPAVPAIFVGAGLRPALTPSAGALDIGCSGAACRVAMKEGEASRFV